MSLTSGEHEDKASGNGKKKQAMVALRRTCPSYSIGTEARAMQVCCELDRSTGHTGTPVGPAPPLLCNQEDTSHMDGIE